MSLENEPLRRHKPYSVKAFVTGALPDGKENLLLHCQCAIFISDVPVEIRWNCAFVVLMDVGHSVRTGTVASREALLFDTMLLANLEDTVG